MDRGIGHVVQRYNDLYDLLRDWGYEVVPDPDFDSWQEIVRDSTRTGHVKLTGTRDNGDGTSMTCSQRHSLWQRTNKQITSDRQITRAPRGTRTVPTERHFRLATWVIT